MVHSPSKRWEDGVLAERAITTDTTGEPEEVEAKATKPYKVPTPTPRSPEEREALRDNQQEVEEKAVQEAENKAVASATTKAKRTRKK